MDNPDSDGYVEENLYSLHDVSLAKGVQQVLQAPIDDKTDEEGIPSIETEESSPYFDY